LVAAIEEERLNRIKHWAGLPGRTARACLEGAQPDHIAISRDPRSYLTDKPFRAALRPHQWLNLTSRAVNSMRITQVGEVLAAEGIVSRESRRVHSSSITGRTWPAHCSRYQRALITMWVRVRECYDIGFIREKTTELRAFVTAWTSVPEADDHY
jgi:hypothetical protein